jgi:hypothetical protein
MRMLSQLGGSTPHSHPTRPRGTRIRWLPPPRVREWSLVFKVLLTIATAAIAIFAAHSLAHAVQVMDRSINQ